MAANMGKECLTHRLNEAEAELIACYRAMLPSRRETMLAAARALRTSSDMQRARLKVVEGGAHP